VARKPSYDVESIRTVSTGGAPHAPARSIKLSIHAGPNVGAEATVGLRAITIGRSQAADFRVSDPTVSTFHVEVASVEGGVRVRDLGSRNGTLYAGARLTEAVVPSGAVLELGASRVKVELDAGFVAEAQKETSFCELRGESVAMRELFSLLRRLSRTDLSLVIEGATGTGKDLVARALHEQGPRAARPFVVLDCTAIPATLAESTLFGHEKGAFTGATDARGGVFEAADGGTVFLDEIGELSAELQPKLLRVLEQRQVTRVGSTRPRPIDVRVIGATWRDVRAMINQGSFREDLYYRLAQARVVVPPLRDRPDDIPVLVRHFLSQLPPGTRAARAIGEEALAELCRRDYPGNVRELRSTVVRVAVTAEGELITPADLVFERMLSGERAKAEGDAPLPDAEPSFGRFKDEKRMVIDEFERGYLERLLLRSGGNVSRAASVAGLERHHLRDLFRKHGLRGSDG
jgi:DNA-binding NtrC family response regulator